MTEKLPQVASPYHIQLDVFEGPLDLLLHLIKDEKVDIYNIPISRIANQYLHYLDVMQSLNLELAGEFLLMAATLAHIKSQLLLPTPENQEDPEEQGADPRIELVKRLLEYQKYKYAAEQLLSRPLLFRDVYKREKIVLPVADTKSPPELVEVSIFKLVDAFHRLVEKLRLEKPHSVEAETITVGERVVVILEAIRTSQEGTVRFAELFEGVTSKGVVVATFLAVLEMLKRGALRVFQPEPFSDIHLIGTPTVYGDWKYDGTDDYPGTTSIPS